MRRMIISLIKFYQQFISPLTPPSCRFFPSCSQYSIESYRRFGVIKGTYLTIVRISKCHPFHPGGVDLVPENKKTHLK